MRKKKSYHHGDLRRALLDATLELVKQQGPAGVSLREAARNAGVSQAAPYRHFPDKDHLLAEAAKEGFDLMRQQLPPLDEGTSPLERVLQWASAYVRFAISHPAHFRLMHGHGSPRKSTTPALQAAARENFQSFLATMRHFAADRLEETQLKELTLQTWSVAHGAANLAIDEQTLFLGIAPSKVEEIARDAVRAQLAGGVLGSERR